MKKSSAKKKPQQMTPAELLPRPTITARRSTTRKAIATVGAGSVYLNEPYKKRPWTIPITTTTVIDYVQALRRAEDEERRIETDEKEEEGEALRQYQGRVPRQTLARVKGEAAGTISLRGKVFWSADDEGLLRVLVEMSADAGLSLLTTDEQQTLMINVERWLPGIGFSDLRAAEPPLRPLILAAAAGGPVPIGVLPPSEVVLDPQHGPRLAAAQADAAPADRLRTAFVGLLLKYGLVRIVSGRESRARLTIRFCCWCGDPMVATSSKPSLTCSARCTEQRDTARKRAQREKERQHLRRQITFIPTTEAAAIVAGEFLSGYPKERLPFTEDGKARSRSRLKGGRKRASTRAPWRVTIRTRVPRLSPPLPGSAAAAENDQDSALAEV